VESGVSARITDAQARALGLVTKTKPRTTRRVARGGAYHTVCMTCGEEFHTRASEDRHVEATHHARYQLVVGFA
jgi:hypothetical protein